MHVFDCTGAKKSTSAGVLSPLVKRDLRIEILLKKNSSTVGILTEKMFYDAHIIPILNGGSQN